MLQEVLVKNFAIIEELQLDWQDKLTVITGETGAGKSIILDAIELALGKRANSQVIYPGKEKADVSLTFDLTHHSAAKAWLTHLDLTDDNQCVIRRAINRDGRSKSYINGIPVSLPQLRELADFLLSLHGQHEFQTLLHADKQREVLDSFAQHDKLLTETNQQYQQWQNLNKEYTALKDQQQQIGQLDLWQYQLRELEEQHYTTEELNTLETEQKQFAHAEKILQASQAALNCLTDAETNALALIDHSLYALQNLTSISPVFSSALPTLEQARMQINEVTHDIRHQMNKMDLAPERMAEVEQRLSKAFELARKHHSTMQELPQITEKLREQVNKLSHASEHLIELEQQIQQAKQQYLQTAIALRQSRIKAAKKLAKSISEYLPALGMAGGKFDIELLPLNDDTPRPQGLDKVHFLVSANPGLPLQSLNKIASGGELSRISLAIQVIIAQFYPGNTLIFDEVDVGIGGATADQVGQLLRKIGENTQVICVTHLAQVAAKGHHHLRVEKQQTNQSTKTTIKPLSAAERIQEIARMSGGIKIDEKTLEHAKALLECVD